MTADLNRTTRTTRPTAFALPTAALLAAALLPGCNSSPKVATADTPATPQNATLTLHLEDQDAVTAPVAPVSYERLWTGDPLFPGELTADHQPIVVRFAVPDELTSQGVERREAWLGFPAEQIAVTDGASTRIVRLERPAVTLVLARDSSAQPTDTGVARITFAPFFQETVFDLDPEAQADDALWLALSGISVDETRAFSVAQSDFDLNETVELVRRGVNPYDVLALEDTGTLFDYASLRDLDNAGVTVPEAVTYLAEGVPGNVDALIAFDRGSEESQDAALAVYEGQGDDAVLNQTAAVEAEEAVSFADDSFEADATESEPSVADAETENEADADSEATAVAVIDDSESTEAEVIEAGSTKSAAAAPVAVAVVDDASDDADAYGDFDWAGEIEEADAEPTPSTPFAYAEALAPLGFTQAADQAKLYVAGVTAEQVLWFRNAGLEPTVADMIDAHTLGLDPVAARMLVDAGYDVTFDDLKTLHAANVDAAYAVALVDDRFRPLSATQIAELWQNRISLADVRAAREHRLAQMRKQDQRRTN